MQLHKIRQYNISALALISFYRILYEIMLLKRRLSYKHRRYPIINVFNKVDAKVRYANYYKRVRKEKDIIDNANKIVNGYIYLFGQWFPFDYSKDWLKDPISNCFWNRDIYSYKAPFVEENHADVKYVLEANKLNPLVSVAHAYFLSGDEKYVIFLKKALDDWISCVPLECSVANRIVMDIAYRAINLIHISLLCFDSDFFCREVFPTILGLLQHHEGFMWSRLGNRWFKSDNDNNHNVGELVGIYVTQLWLMTFFDTDYSHRQVRETKYLISVLDKIIAPSGAYMEQSGNYTKVVAEFIDLFELFLSANNENVSSDYYKKNYRSRLVNYLIHITYNDLIDNFGDNDGAVVLLPFEKNTYSIEHLYNRDFTPSNSDYSDASQWVYNSNDGKRVHIFARAGVHAYYVEGAYIHAHNDNLSIILSMYGSRLFIDKGCYLYNSGVEVRNEYTSLSSHNSVYFEGIDSSQIMSVGFKNYPYCKLISNKMECDTAIFKGVLKYRGIIYERTILYEEGKVSIIDQVTERPSDKDLCFLSFLLSPEISIQSSTNNTLILNDINNNKFEIVFEGVECIEIYEEEYYPSYAIIKKTNRIKARINLLSNITTTTTIRIIQ